MTTASVRRVHDYMRYKKQFHKQAQKRKTGELSKWDTRRKHIVNTVYSGGRVTVRAYT